MDRIADLLAPHGLRLAGGFHPLPEDGVPEGVATLLLVAPDPVHGWEAFAASPEAMDGAAEPMDRWSARVIGGVAAEVHAQPFYPFGGPPWLPFIRWAGRAEGARPSPIGMLVSGARGLWTSYRGALGLATVVAQPPVPAADPCEGCPAPCLTACPVSALGAQGYDVPACTAHLDSPEGAPCHDGCLARRACPLGATPPLAQRRFHMQAFRAARRRAAAGEAVGI